MIFNNISKNDIKTNEPYICFLCNKPLDPKVFKNICKESIFTCPNNNNNHKGFSKIEYHFSLTNVNFIKKISTAHLSSIRLHFNKKTRLLYIPEHGTQVYQNNMRIMPDINVAPDSLHLQTFQLNDSQNFKVWNTIMTFKQETIQNRSLEQLIEKAQTYLIFL